MFQETRRNDVERSKLIIHYYYILLYLLLSLHLLVLLLLMPLQKVLVLRLRHLAPLLLSVLLLQPAHLILFVAACTEFHLIDGRSVLAIPVISVKLIFAAILLNAYPQFPELSLRHHSADVRLDLDDRPHLLLVVSTNQVSSRPRLESHDVAAQMPELV